MADADNIIVRRFQPADRSAVRNIACETAFLEAVEGRLIEDDEILADILTLYYTDYEPESCFVAVNDSEIIGYIIGTKNAKRADRIFSYRIIPLLSLKYFFKGNLFRKKYLRLGFDAIKSKVNGEFAMPDFSNEYPAELHINLKKGFRGGGVGRKLIEHFLSYLKENGIHGVHLTTMSDNAKLFFERVGFQVLHKTQLSFLRFYLHKSIPYYSMGRIV